MYKGFLFFLLLFGNIFYGGDSAEKKDVDDNKEYLVGELGAFNKLSNIFFYLN